MHSASSRFWHSLIFGPPCRTFGANLESCFARQPTKYQTMTFAVDILLSRSGEDAFATKYETPAQRLRYELSLGVGNKVGGYPQGIYVRSEQCKPIARKDDQASFLGGMKISYNSRVAPFIKMSDFRDALLVRQDGRQKHGRPMQLPLREASKTALSTITTADFHICTRVKEALTNVKFLEIVPQAAASSKISLRRSSTSKRCVQSCGGPCALAPGNRVEAATRRCPCRHCRGPLFIDILSVNKIKVIDDPNNRQYAFGIDFVDGLTFSSRVISDGTLRLLALLTLLNDPQRSGALCFEEPENGVHEGRIKSSGRLPAHICRRFRGADRNAISSDTQYSFSEGDGSSAG